MPIWLLHDGNTAFVFDRSSAKGNISPITLDRKTLGPLPRIELNLGPAEGSTAPTSVRGKTTNPGGRE